MRFVIVMALLTVGCAKIGDPLPPFIRVPVPVGDLSVDQEGTEIVLRWTNPARNIDGSSDMDLQTAWIHVDSQRFVSAPVAAPGQAQEWRTPTRGRIGVTTRFAVEVETTRMRRSALSNGVAWTAVDVPSRVRDLRGFFDQNRAILEWSAPESEVQPDGYEVTRDGQPSVAGSALTATAYTDPFVEAGRSYTYSVVGLRQVGERRIRGDRPQTVMVTALDRTAPRQPGAPELTVTDQGAFVNWPANTETDLAGYRLYRSVSEAGTLERVSEFQNNAFFDRQYRAGIYYAVSAIDRSGNESTTSERVSAP